MYFSLSTDRLSTYIIFSFILHGVVATSLVIISHFRGFSFEMPKNVYQVNLVSLKSQSEKSKPSNQLPQTTIEQMKKERPQTKTEGMQIPTKDAEQLKREKELTKLSEQIKEEIELEQAISQITEQTAEELAQAEGIQAGSPNGNLVEAYEMTQYRDQVRQHVLASWNLPKWTVDSLPKNTQAIIIVYIDEKGNITRSDFQKPSNLAFFDQSVLRAIRRASPLPVPPEKIAKEARISGIVMRFSPEKVQ